MNTQKISTDWDPQLYLKYKNERTQPSIDLVSKINIDNPLKIIDIGCGPGNSTQILFQRWPESLITGVDNSPQMIEKAKSDYPKHEWILSDALYLDSKIKYSIVFSNATIQWIPNHKELILKLFNMLEINGVLAIQVPMFRDMPLGKSIEVVANKSKWNQYTKGCVDLFTYNNYSFYYNVLAPLSKTIDIWETSYIHILDSQKAILEWIRSTGMKPYLDRLENDEMKNEFEMNVLEEIINNYPVQNNGKVLFSFKRLFFIAYN